MRIEPRLLLLAAAVGMSGCVVGAASSDTRGVTRAHYAGPTTVRFTNASPDRMCGFYMTDDAEDSYGDNWLPEAGVPSGGSIDFAVKPGKYKARWDTCRNGSSRPYYAATLWREAAIKVTRETQLYAYVSDNVPPTKRAATMGRDFNVVRFPGQAIDPNPQGSQPRSQQVALRASDEPPQVVGFIGLVLLNAEMVARFEGKAGAGDDRFSAHDFVDGNARPAPPKPGDKKPTPEKPSLNRKHDLSSGGVEYNKH